MIKRRSYITSHGDQMSPLLKQLDDLILVLGEHLGKPIGCLDKVTNLRKRIQRGVGDKGGGLHPLPIQT